MQIVELATTHPDAPGYSRKAVIRRTLHYDDEKYILMVVDIQYYKNGVLVNNPQGIIRTITVELRADNSLLVDENGNYIFPGENGYTAEELATYKGEYQYLHDLEKTPQTQSVEQFKEAVVLKAEFFQRFDR